MTQPGNHEDWPPEDRLSGWKEIASFLGRGVRTAQRWERERGLPIRRVGQGRSEIIFASRVELSAWLRQQPTDEPGGSADTSPSDHTADVAAIPPPAPTAARPAGRSVWWVAGLAALLVIAAGAWLLRPRPGEPASLRPADDGVAVVDANGREVFAYPLPAPIRADTFAQPLNYGRGRLFLFEDLDGDGVRDIVLGARHGRSVHDAFHVLKSDGTVLAIVRPDNAVTFGDETFPGPWLPHRAWVDTNPDGALSLYLSFTDLSQFPTQLLEVSAGGDLRSRYVSNGYITLLEFIEKRGQRSLMLGAANNETLGASLAVFHSGRAVGTAPAVKPHYRCLDCPDGGPDEFLVFPPADGLIDSLSNASVNELFRDLADVLHISVSYLSGSQGPETSVRYSVDRDLQPTRVEVTQGFYYAHRRWVADGVVDHDVNADIDGPNLQPIQRWMDGGFIDLPEIDIDWSHPGMGGAAAGGGS